MKTPLVIMSRSGMSTYQKVQILANEVTRRLFNINKNGVEQAEFNKVVDQITQELKISEYNYKTAREIVISGIRGWRTRLNRREQKGQEQYRPAHTTTKIREHKKLFSKESWYKQSQTDENTSQNV